MKYIEENLKTRAPTASEPSQDPQPANPHDDLYRITATAGAKTEASAPNSLAMLTAIPEVDLGMTYVFSLLVWSCHQTTAGRGSRTSKRLKKPGAHLLMVTLAPLLAK
jgi:hypothetical protein